MRGTKIISQIFVYCNRNVYSKYIKRLLDITLSAITLIILSPVMLLTAVLIRVKLGSPVIFRQKRPGKDEEIFELYKFRSMTDRRDDNGVLLPDELRLTAFGRRLRATSLDELPELFNILKGDMSIVGPRPLLVQYLPLYSKDQRRRHDVRPGLTGMAQVNGRNGIDWEEKFKWDLEYIHKISFLTDLKIILATFYKVVKQEGIDSDHGSGMEPFYGSEKLGKSNE